MVVGMRKIRLIQISFFIVTVLSIFLLSPPFTGAVSNDLIQKIIEEKNISLCGTDLACIEKASYELKDIQLCDQFSNAIYRRRCIFDSAIATGYPNNCDPLEDQFRENCYYKIAINTLNRDVCGKIIWSPSSKEDCFAFFADKESKEDCENATVKKGNCLCKEDEFLYEEECEKLECKYNEYPSEHKCKKLECKEGEVIFENSCVSAQCNDSDKGINPNKVGVCKDVYRGESSEAEDQCITSKNLREFYCKDNQCEVESFDCEEYCYEKGFSYGKCKANENLQFAKCDCFNNELKLYNYRPSDYEGELAFNVLKNYIIFGIYLTLFLFIISMLFFLKKLYNKLRIKKLILIPLSLWSILSSLLFYFLYLDIYIKTIGHSLLHLRIFSISSLIIISIVSSFFGLDRRLRREDKDKIFSFIFSSSIFSLISLMIINFLLRIIDALPYLLSSEEGPFSVLLFSILIGFLVGIIFSIILVSLSSLIVELSFGKGFIQNIKKLNWKIITISLIIPIILLIVGSLAQPLHGFWSPRGVDSFMMDLAHGEEAIAFYFFTFLMWILIIIFSLFLSFIIPYIFSKKYPKTHGMVSSTMVIIIILLIIVIPLIPTFIENTGGDIKTWKMNNEEKIRIQGLKPECGNGVCEGGELMLTCEKDCKLSGIHNYKLCGWGSSEIVEKVKIFGTSKALRPSPLLNSELKVEPRCGVDIGLNECIYCYELNDVREPIFEIQTDRNSNLPICNFLRLYLIDDIKEDCNESKSKYLKNKAYYPYDKELFEKYLPN